MIFLNQDLLDEGEKTKLKNKKAQFIFIDRTAFYYNLNEKIKAVK